MPQLKMPTIFNMVFKVNLTKSSIRTFSCLYVASSKWSHSNVTNYVNMHKELHFAYFTTKSIRHHSGCGHSLLNDFDFGGPIRQLKGARDYLFQQWTHAPSLGVQLVSTLQHMFPCALQLCKTISNLFWPIQHLFLQSGGGASQNITSRDAGKTSSWASSKTLAPPPHSLVDVIFEITIDANKSRNFNHKTMQIKLQTYPIPNIAKKNCTFLLSYLTIWFNET